MSPARPRCIEVLVVDDSALVRQVILKMLASTGEFHVTVAPDPIFALAKMQHTRPDVIVLDLEMPRMDGLSFLRKIMAEDPIPVIVCSARGAEESVLAAARAEGAVDVVTKPAMGVRAFMDDSATLFVSKVRAAAAAPLVRRTSPTGQIAGAPAHLDEARPSTGQGALAVIALGASTGGTQALRKILSELPCNLPPVVIVQHMPAGFTSSFARDLDRTSRLSVREVENGERLTAGEALLARGNHHLLVQRSGGHLVARVDDGPRVSRHRPSVDVLFHSVARCAGALGVGVILTGMGCDGADGLLAMRRAGGRTLAQDEASSVIFGMPREAIARGAAEQVVGLDDVAAAITELARQVERRGMNADGAGASGAGAGAFKAPSR